VKIQIVPLFMLSLEERRIEEENPAKEGDHLFFCTKVTCK